MAVAPPTGITGVRRRPAGDDRRRVPSAVEAKGLSTDRVGLWGWSLGGYGALLLATELPHRQLGPVVATHRRYGRPPRTPLPTSSTTQLTSPRTVFDRVDELAHVQLRIDIGDNDSFTPNVEPFIAALPASDRRGDRGFHDAAYWMRAAPDEIDFIGRRLAGKALREGSCLVLAELTRSQRLVHRCLETRVSGTSLTIERVMIRAPPARLIDRPSARWISVFAGVVYNAHTSRSCFVFFRYRSLTVVLSGLANCVGRAGRVGLTEP